MLFRSPFNSLGTALSTFAGQNVGAAKPDRVVKGYHRSMLISTAFGLLMLGVFAFTSRYIVGFFVAEEQVIDIGAKALLLSACFYVPLGFIHTTRGLLNGACESRPQRIGPSNCLAKTQVSAKAQADV